MNDAKSKELTILQQGFTDELVFEVLLADEEDSVDLMTVTCACTSTSTSCTCTSTSSTCLPG